MTLLHHARRITIKELHARPGELVRRAATSRSPIYITDRGTPVAALASLSLVGSKKRPRTLLPEFLRMMRRKPGTDLAADLDAARGDR